MNWKKTLDNFISANFRISFCQTFNMSWQHQCIYTKSKTEHGFVHFCTILKTSPIFAFCKKFHWPQIVCHMTNVLSYVNICLFVGLACVRFLLSLDILSLLELITRVLHWHFPGPLIDVFVRWICFQVQLKILAQI